MTQTIRTLAINYMSAKAGLREKLPNVPDDVLEQVAHIIAQDGSALPVKRGRPRKQNPPRRSTASDRAKVLSTAAEIVGTGSLTTGEIHGKLVDRGVNVYLPYLGVMLSGSEQFERTVENNKSRYRVRVPALKVATVVSRKLKEAR